MNTRTSMTMRQALDLIGTTDQAELSAEAERLPEQHPLRDVDQQSQRLYNIEHGERVLRTQIEAHKAAADREIEHLHSGYTPRPLASALCRQGRGQPADPDARPRTHQLRPTCASCCAPTRPLSSSRLRQRSCGCGKGRDLTAVTHAFSASPSPHRPDSANGPGRGEAAVDRTKRLPRKLVYVFTA